MYTDDIQVALEFMAGCDYDYIVLACRWDKDVPLLRRKVAELLGAPSRVDPDGFVYGDRKVYMMSTVHEDSLDAYPEERVFLVNREGHNDFPSVGKPRMVPYLMMPWVSLIDVYNWMVRDGIDPDVVLSRMACDNLIWQDPSSLYQ